jgi:hypothetical protein
MSRTQTPNTRPTPPDAARTTRRILGRLGYTIGADGTVFGSIEDGGQPVGQFSDVILLAESLGCLGERDAADPAALARLDLALFERTRQAIAA